MVNSLKETVEKMLSDDYKERFIAEYDQLSYRVDKLEGMLSSWEMGTLDFTPKTPKDVLKEQYSVMLALLNILKKRAEFEGIDL